MKIRIAQIKIVPEKGELKANHEQLMATLNEIAADTVDVVVTPECFLDGYVSTEAWVTADNIIEYAVDPAGSSLVKRVSEWARANTAWVVLGCTRLTAAGAYNTALILDRKGALKGAYDKIHCQTHDKKYLPGQKLTVFDSDFSDFSDFGPFGVMICADRRWPETVRSLALQGARIIFNPTYGMHDEKNLRMMQTRSYESEIFIAFTHPRQALLTDPRGEIIYNETGEDTSFVICEVDLAEVDTVRAGASAHLKDRRPEIYRGL